MTSFQKNLVGWLSLVIAWVFLWKDSPFLGLVFSVLALFCFGSNLFTFKGGGPLRPA
jgi:hypothetical protein